MIPVGAVPCPNVAKRLSFGGNDGYSDKNTHEIAMTDIPVITRHRFEVRRRVLTVTDKQYLTPHMIRLIFSADTFEAFTSLAPDDHIKLFFDTPDGPAMRDYTPRHIDTAAERVTIDFAVHEAGPATAWAVAAEVGSTLNIGGPRGSGVVSPEFDWYLLIGDETALPAIGRWLEEAPARHQITALIAVRDGAEEQVLPSDAQAALHWLHRADPAEDAGVFIKALDGLRRPEGRGFIWIACEAMVAKTVRTHLLEAWSHPLTDLKSSGYWYAGQAFDDAKKKEAEAEGAAH